jgi:FkbM family methyltransferase
VFRLTNGHMHQYLKEVRTCWRLGHRWRDRLRLIAGCLEFHLSNLVGWSAAVSPTAYRIRLDGIRTIYLRRRSGDIFVFHEIFTSLCYHLPGPVAPKEPSVIVDLGANIGLTTLFLASRFPGAKHVCVEPHPANVAVLRMNLASMQSRVHIIEAAAADKPGEAEFNESPWSWGGHLVERGRSTHSVRCITVDEIISTCGLEAIDVLKVDIEGAEERVFAARPSWLGKTGCIIIELHSRYSLNQFRRDVADQGFVVIDPGSPMGNSMVVAVSATRDRARRRDGDVRNDREVISVA